MHDEKFRFGFVNKPQSQQSTNSSVNTRVHLGLSPRLEVLRPLPCCVTWEDYSRLESHLYGAPPRKSPLVIRLLRAKLADASVVPSDAVDDDVATINSRLVYVVDGYRSDSRVLVNCENDLAVGLNLPVTTLLGATLLGMRSGQRAALLREDGTIGHVLLKRVAYQPQATHKAISSVTVNELLPQDRGPDLDKKIVRLDSKPTRENTTLCNSTSGPDDSGPGPAAA